MVVAALVCLAHKYQVDYVRDAYLSRMKSCFCTDLKMWNGVHDAHGSAVMRYSNVDAITAVNIARLTGTNSMLPTALYLCCQLDVECLLNGSPRLGGTLECLSRQDFVRCMNARQSLLTSTVLEDLDFYIRSLQRGPKLHEHCQHEIDVIRREHLVGSLGLPPSEDALASEVPSYRASQKKLWWGMCAECAEAMGLDDQLRRTILWCKLPELLALEAPAEWPEPPAENFRSTRIVPWGMEW
ncbi:uncharacterized protein C8Q71DRAFT_155065 [Rhodofomes roseus]|uniref:Uncharacterized protein n=1 Tax=Rhodofomes roseus TaxID=34475 RepID=A0ABQ8K9M0_9APHY|nr:uncharacterized protein C8Q71DRAFT_155065 [Rhodofomes roseus]KAH9833993.1 hypothetical protein C8Q71DRAFT_155065 [Rhodofomes roseus]